MNRKKIGNLLTLLGVLAWVPFLYLVATDQEPSIFPFLIVHLSGVLIVAAHWDHHDVGEEIAERMGADLVVLPGQTGAQDTPGDWFALFSPQVSSSRVSNAMPDRLSFASDGWQVCADSNTSSSVSPSITHSAYVRKPSFRSESMKTS